MCMHSRTFVAHEVAAYTCVNIGECTIISVGRIQGIAPGGRSPLFSDQSDARGSEKDLFWDRPLGFWMTASPSPPPPSPKDKYTASFKCSLSFDNPNWTNSSILLVRGNESAKPVLNTWEERGVIDDRNKEQLWSRLEYVLILWYLSSLSNNSHPKLFS